MFANHIPRNAFDIRLLGKANFDSYLHSIPGLSPQFNLQETSGSVANAWNTAVPLGRELVVGGMNIAYWNAISSGTKSNPSPDVLRIARNGVANPAVYQSINAVGKTYNGVWEARSDGFATPAVLDNSGATIWSGSAAHTNWQPVDMAYVNSGAFLHLFAITNTGTEYTEWRLVSIKQTNILASSAYGTPGDNPLDGADTATTVGVATGIASTPYARRFDGATSFINIYSAELNSVFNPDAGTLIAFAKSTTWAAGVDLIVRLGVDADNEIYLSRSGTDLILSYDAGGTAEAVTIASGSPTGFFMVALTWDTTGGGEVKAYYQGLQSGATQTIAGTFVGNLASTLTCIGANSTTPTNVWSGDIMENPLLANRALTPGEIGNIYQRWGG